MFYEIAALANLHLPERTQENLQKLSTHPIVFPTDQPGEDQLIKRTHGSTIVLISPGTRISSKYFDACPSVKHVLVCGTSTANIDRVSAADHSVAIHNITGYGDDAGAKSIFQKLTRLTDIDGRQMGVLGLGAVGSAVARRAKSSGMEVSYYSPRRKTDTDAGGISNKSLPELLSSSDVIALCGPGNLGVLSRQDFDHMKPGSTLIQVSAGDVMDMDGFTSWIAKNDNHALFDGAAGKETVDVVGNKPRVLYSNQHSGLTNEARQVLGVKVMETPQRIVN